MHGLCFMAFACTMRKLLNFKVFMSLKIRNWKAKASDALDTTSLYEGLQLQHILGQF